MRLTVALTGLARSGKDTFCALLIEELAKEGLKAKRFALADNLKKELQPFIMAQYGIDILNCTPEEKELVRDFLVFHGKMKRLKSQGRHWTSKLETEIRLTNDIDVAIVTDARYDVFPEDELTWAKQNMGGVLVHIKRYNLIWGAIGDEGVRQYINATVPTAGERAYVQPPNEDERRNDPRLEAKADFKVDWETGDFETNCRPAVKEFVQYLKDHQYISL